MIDQPQPDADPTRIYSVDAHRIAWRQVGQEGVVLDLTTSVYFGLNRSAGALWPLLLAGSTHPEMVEMLMTKAPNLDSQRAAAEVSSFLVAVDAEGLLVVGASDG